MRLHLDIGPAADRDIVELADYLAAHSLDAAINFLASLRRSMEFLTTTSGAGPEYPTTDPRLAGLRKWAVDGHRNYLIFYRVLPEAIQIIRVLNGSRELSRLFEETEL